MNCLQVVKHRLESLPYEPIENALRDINITTRNNNDSIRNTNEIIEDVTEFFKLITFENKQDWEEVHEKYYKDGYVQNQIYCHDRDLIEERMKNRNILMYDVCNNLAGIREGLNLYRYMINRL